MCASSQYNTFTADVNYSDKSAHLFSTDGFYCFTLTCFMDSYTKIVSSKFIVDFPMVLLGHLQYSIKLELNCFTNVQTNIEDL